MIDSVVSDLPPAMTSLLLTDASPTRASSLALNWGVTVGQYTHYCILENMTDENACVWRTGSLPSSYVDSSADGPFALTAYLRNIGGISLPVTSNTITIDRTPPILASVSVTNSDPTANPTFGLSFGAILHGYDRYCIRENSNSVAGCSWVMGALPASYAVSSANGSKVLTVWLADAAGNVSSPLASAAIELDTLAATVAITSPAAGAYVNAANVAAFAVSGTCSESGRAVIVTGAASASATCSGAGTWAATLDFSAASAGAIAIQADHGDAAGNAAVPATRSFTKDVVAPTVAIATPAAGAYVNAANMAAFAVTGTCSENGRDVVISGSASATVACAAGAWSANLDFSGAASGAVTIDVDHADAAGNPAVRASRSFTKDVVAPTVAIATPAAGAYVNAANVAAFAVTGTCSENGRDVAISGSASATVACAAGAWSANLDFSAAAAGAVTINVNHADAGGNPAAQASRSFTKDVVVPTVAISTPAAGASVNAANVAAFAVTGTCSENGRTVAITGDASANVLCTAGAWTANLDFSGAAAGTVTINVNHSDAAGNPATQASRSFTKDVIAPTVAFATPAAGSVVNSVNLASFAVTGTCSENGRDVVIAGDASATVACVAGAWSANLDFSAASDGTVTVTADHADAAGNPATQASRSFTKSTGLPTLTIAAPGAGAYVNAANVASFAVSGACAANGEDVVITGSASATVTCAAGAWSANLDFSAAAPGAVSITVNHSDAGGNPANPQTRSFTKDVAAPTVAISTPAAGAAVNAVNVAAFAVTGTCSENGRAVVITGDATANPTCTAGAWSANLDFSAAAAGTVTIDVNHADAAGNPATQASRSFTKDVTAPTVAISTPAAGAYVNAANAAAFAVTGTCSENGRDVVLSGDASATVACAAGAWTANLDFSAAGAGTLTVYADHADAAGNPATQASRTFTKDVAAPTVAISTPAAGAYVNAANVAAFAVTGVCSENGRAVAITGDATANPTCTAGAWSANLDFSAAAAGTVTINVNHADAAGNPATQASRSFTKDVAAPTVAFATPAAGAYVNAANAASFAVTGTCSENGRDVVLSGDASATVACAAGAWSANLDFSAAAAGAVTLNANHADAAGNPATQASRSFTKDVVAPTILSVTGPANATYLAGQNLDFTVVFSDAVSVTGAPSIPLTIGAGSRSAVYQAGSGTATWTFRYVVASGDQDLDGIVSASPVALNAGTIREASGNPAVLTFTPPTTTGVLVDAVAPTISSITGPSNNCYYDGEHYDFAVTFSEPVTRTGNPRLALTVGSATRYATYQSGSGTANWSFRYTVASGDFDSDGIAVTTPLDANGGTLRDGVSNDATLSFSAPSLVGVFANSIQFNGPVRAILPAPDHSGKVYVGGDFTQVCGQSRVALVRLDATGQRVDTSFSLGTGFSGTLGTAVTTVFALADAANDSGDVYVGGSFTTFDGNSQNGLVRLNADGTRDAAFAVGTGFSSRVRSLLALPDGSGKLLVGGHFHQYKGNDQNRIARLTSTGGDDAGFVSSDALGFGFTGTCFVPAMVIPPDGSNRALILNKNCNTRHALRLTTAGASDGTIPSNFGTSWGWDSIALDVDQPDRPDTHGAFYTAGDGHWMQSVTYSGGYGAFGDAIYKVGRWFVTGYLDMTFDTQEASGKGFARNSDDVTTYATKFVTTTPDGSGEVFYLGDFNKYRGVATPYGIVRLRRNGAPRTDAAFNPATGFNNTPYTMAFANDGTGRAFVGGTFTTYNGGGAPRFKVLDLYAASAAVPRVTGVTSSTPAATYGAGSTISVQIDFSENVVVDTTGGTPYLILRTGNTTAGRASYVSGSGSSTLTFEYTVRSGDSAADLDYMDSASLLLHGGTIAGTDGAADLRLDHPGTATSLGAAEAIVLNAP